MLDSVNLNGIVSLLFAIIELALFANVVIFSEKNSLNKKASALIALLFVYQLLEFLICYAGFNSVWWIYFALIDITLLPPLGLMLILELVGHKRNKIKFVFLPAIFFAVYYLIYVDGLFVTLCTIFTAGYKYPLSFWYGIFYYAPIAAGFYFLIQEIVTSTSSQHKKLCGFLLAGYSLSFIPPAVIAVLLPKIMPIIESFLCKFAIFLAIAAAYFAISNKQTKTAEKS